MALPTCWVDRPALTLVLARAGQALSSPALLFACLVPMLLLGAGLALWLQPQPHSDWAYYWSAAGAPSKYERGGLGLWLLAIPKALGLSPVASALCLNLPAAAAMLWLARKADRDGAGGLWLVCAAYLLLVTPFMGLVQLDLLAATLLAAGAWMAVAGPRGWSRMASAAWGAALVAMAVSTKPQYALTLWTMLVLLALPWLVWRKRAGRGLPALLLVLLAGSVAGFAADAALRAIGDRDESIRTSSAVTLYGGLLVSGVGQGCGYWSVEAAQAAKADLARPLHEAAIDRLSRKPASHWLAVIRCKLPEILRPPPYATYWLVESPSVRTAIDADPRRASINARYYRILGFERLLYLKLTLLILVMAACTSALAAWRRNALAALLPLAWIASFWLVHLVFEIQGRYFLGMYLLAPLFCALSLALSTRPRAPGVAGGSL